MHDSPAARARCEHVAAFFKITDSLASRIAWFVADGLATGEQVIVLATERHRGIIRRRLAENGLALDRVEAERRVLWLDADAVLSALTIRGVVNVDAFRTTLQRFIDPTIRQRVYGELVSLLVARGDIDAALAIESLGHELAHTLNIPVLCGYHAGDTQCLTAAAVAAIESAHDRSLFAGQPIGAEPVASGAVIEATPLHAVRFYENRESLAQIVGKFLGEGFVAGLPAIVIATPEHTAAIKDVLLAHYFDLTRLQTAGDLILMDAGETLSQFMRDGLPATALFRDAMLPVIERACRGRTDCLIRAYGEMVDVLWKNGDSAAAIRLEILWNQLAQTHSFSLLCGYSMGHFYKDVSQQDIRRQHTHLVADSGEHITLH